MIKNGTDFEGNESRANKNPLTEIHLKLFIWWYKAFRLNRMWN